MNFFYTCTYKSCKRGVKNEKKLRKISLRLRWELKINLLELLFNDFPLSVLSTFILYHPKNTKHPNIQIKQSLIFAC